MAEIKPTTTPYTDEEIRELIQSGEQFPFDLDRLWPRLGHASRVQALEALDTRPGGESVTSSKTYGRRAKFTRAPRRRNVRFPRARREEPPRLEYVETPTDASDGDTDRTTTVEQACAGVLKIASEHVERTGRMWEILDALREAMAALGCATKQTEEGIVEKRHSLAVELRHTLRMAARAIADYETVLETRGWLPPPTMSEFTYHSEEKLAPVRDWLSTHGLTREAFDEIRVAHLRCDAGAYAEAFVTAPRATKDRILALTTDRVPKSYLAALYDGYHGKK
jgi:hypothetical protein